jgi:hypothetical protein
MTNKVYRTAQGKIVDLGALQLRNENVRAVGNMGVNARGDLVDSQNRAIDPRTQQVSRQYQKQTTNVQNQSTHAVKSKNKTVAPTKTEATIMEPDITDTIQPEEGSASGLAAAIARARQIKQAPLDPPAKSSGTPGVKKI